jgi:hypothetical protein
MALLNAIAERDKQIHEQAREIAHYKRQYEIAVQRRMKERHDRTERRKDIVTLAVLLIVAAFVFMPMTILAFQQTILWAAGM